MEIIKISKDKEKLILISLIVSDKFCEIIIPILHENKQIIMQSFSSLYKTVLNWCIDYYLKYNTAPHNHIQEIYEDKKNSLKEEDQDLISQFLSHLSNKYEREENYNEQYVIDLSLKYLRELNLNILQKQITEFKDEGEIDAAEDLIFKYNKLDVQTEIKQETKLFSDIDYACKICDNNFSNDTENRLFKLKGDLGNKLNWFCREDFFSINAPTKTGKSFYIREIALICVEHGLNVVVFNLEMSHFKYMRNFYQNVTNEVKEIPDNAENINIKIPYFEMGTNGKYNIKYEELKKYGLNSRKIKGVFKKQKIKTKGEIIVRSFPCNTLTYQKMAKILDDYVLEGFVTDVVLIDYLDNLKTPYKGDHRHGIDDKWSSIRSLAQQKHICIGTVSHTNKMTFKKDVAKGDSVEDLRKETYITQLIGLNQSPEDKIAQVMRVNVVHSRDEDHNEKEMFLSLESRSIGRVMIDTMSLNKVNYNIKKEK